MGMKEDLLGKKIIRVECGSIGDLDSIRYVVLEDGTKLAIGEVDSASMKITGEIDRSKISGSLIRFMTIAPAPAVVIATIPEGGYPQDTKLNSHPVRSVDVLKQGEKL